MPSGIVTSPDGRRVVNGMYISPTAFGEPLDVSGSAWHSAQWDPKTGTVRTPFKWGQAATLGTAIGLAAPYAVGALAGGGGGGAYVPGAANLVGGSATNAAAASIAAPAVTAGATGGSMGFTLKDLLPTLLGKGFDAGANIYGANRANAAANRGYEIQAANDDRLYQLALKQEAEQKAQWEAQQAQAAKEFAATEEERAYQRTLSDYNLSLLKDRETRLAPYRAASTQALASLGSILGLGGGHMASPWLSPSNVGRSA